MFSEKEREFLALLARGGTTTQTKARIRRAFPNPVYRRKLLWGIRRKARGALQDWELYGHAARAESKVLPLVAPGSGGGGGGVPPLYADPLVSLLRAGRRRKVLPARPPPPVPEVAPPSSTSPAPRPVARRAR